MNEERLYVNGEQVDLKNSSPLAYTMQVNDIGDIANRQSSFSRTIELPLTPINKRIFEFLGVAGNNSILPYNRLEIDYYLGNDCIIYKGWGVVTETDIKGYKLHIYDGVINLFKAIENRSLAELDLSDINHDKNLTTVTNTWVNELDYKYIIADYNGKAKYDGTKYNIDYLVPSAKVSYIFNQIFEFADSTYEGEIFSNVDFQNIYMTYPKGVLTVLEGDEDPIMTGTTFNFLGDYGSSPNRRFIKFTGSPTIISGSTTVQSNQIHVDVNESGTYRIRVKGKLKYSASNSNMNLNARLGIAYNVDPTTNPDTVGMGTNNWFHYFQAYGTYFDNDKVIALNAGDSFCLMVNAGNSIVNDEGCELIFEVTKLKTNEINFNDALAEFKMTDFLKEICWRYSLTIFKDKYSNNYKFLTLNERINNAERVNWSNKYQSLKNEKYIYGDYSQKNIFHHKYNDSASSYFDGVINIYNKNLQDEKNVIESKLYAPEKFKNTTDFQFESNIYKLWDKEINENEGVQEIVYKPLDKRFYFLKAENHTFSPAVTVGSEELIQSTSITTAPIETFDQVKYSYVVDNYYKLIGNVISQAKVLTATFNLTSLDISNFDFAKLYYIEQLGGYFFVNKINNWQANKLTEVEIIKLENDIQIPYLSGGNGGYDTSDGLAPYITIDNFQVIYIDAWQRKAIVLFTTNILTSQLSANGGLIPNSSPYEFYYTSTGYPNFTVFKILSVDGTTQSNGILYAQ